MQNKNRNGIFGQAVGDGKRLSTHRAHLAQLGFVLHEAEDGSFFVSRWGQSRSLADLDLVIAFLRQVGGHHG